MAQTIQIKRSSVSNTPDSVTLAEGELAYGHSGDEAGKLVIGRPLASGATPENDVIGGKFFVDKLNDIEANANNYSLPTAANATLGGIKLGDDTAVTNTLATTSTTDGRDYPLQINATGVASVNVPWTDTSYTLPTAASDALGGIKLGYTDSDKNYAVELNEDNQAYVNVPWENTIYTLPTAASDALGGVKVSATASTATLEAITTESNRSYAVQVDNTGVASVNVPWTDSNDDTTYTAGTGMSLSAANEFSIGQAVGTTDTPQFAKIGINTAADATIPFLLNGLGKVTGDSAAFSLEGSTQSGFLLLNTYLDGETTVTRGWQMGVVAQEGSGGEEHVNDFFIQAAGTATEATGGIVFIANRTTGNVAIGTSSVSSTHKLKVDGSLYSTSDILSNSGKLFLTGDSDNTDEGITFGTTVGEGNASGSFKIKHDQSNGALSISDKGTDVIKVPHSDNATGSTNITISRNTDFTGDVEISGDLTVNGSSTTITSTTLAVGDHVITLNDDLAESDATPADDAGLEVERGYVSNTTDSRAKAQLVFDESELEWVVIEPDAADTVTAKAATPILTVANFPNQTFTIDGGTFGETP